MAEKITDDLHSWSDIEGEFVNASILLGNGFSQNIWKKFGYTSLFYLAYASRFTAKSPSRKLDRGLFEKLKTENFETVLNAVSTSKSVLEALGNDISFLDDRETSIRNELINSVHDVHVEHKEVTEPNFQHIANELSKYSSIFTTNYDLLIYWSIIYNINLFCDYFWKSKAGGQTNVFDIGNTDVWPGKVPIHYLHGALHLYKYSDGSTHKMNSLGDNILEQFNNRNSVPLFVSEGTAQQKLTSIKKSEYLTFMLTRLASQEGSMVVFGHKLGETDQHIVNIVSRKKRQIAVSICKFENIMQRKRDVISALSKGKDSKFDVADVKFFDSITHPLGVKTLRV